MSKQRALQPGCHVVEESGVKPLSDGPLLRRLRRVTSSHEYVPIIDGFRFIAIAWVLLFHLLYTLDGSRTEDVGETAGRSFLIWLVSKGHFGVQVFFVLSGFVIALPFVKAIKKGTTVSLGKYYLRRLTRLEPPFVCAILIIYAVLVAKGTTTLAERFPEFLATVSYTHVWIFGEWSRINNVTWSLEVEVQFYAIAPLLAMVFYIKSPLARRMALVFLVVSAAGLKWWLSESPDWVRMTLAAHLAYFFSGFLLADLVGDKQIARQTGVRGRSADLLAFCGAALVLVVISQEWRIAGSKDLALSVLIAATMYAALHSELVFRMLCLPWVSVIGGMCYTIYLYHFPLLRNFARVTTPMTSEASSLVSLFVQQALLITPAVFLVCAVLFVLFEKPFMYSDWPQRIHRALLRKAAS